MHDGNMDLDKLIEQLESEIQEIREEIDRLDDYGWKDQQLFIKLADKQKSLDAANMIKV